MATQQLRIVVVEDEPIIALDVKRKLERSGHRVVSTVTSGAAAIDLAAQLQPDLLVMDIGLQGPVDGLSAVGTIWKARKIPVVFVSAYSDEDIRQEIAYMHPAGLVLKPIEEKDLLTQIEHVFSVSILAAPSGNSCPCGTDCG